MTSTLHVLLGDAHVGVLVRARGGRVSFVYDEAWQRSGTSVPLSVSMPLAVREHGPRVVEPYLWGLLPDNDLVLERWGARFHVSARNPFALLGHVGEDCAGAVRFVASDRLGAVPKESSGSVAWLSEDDIAERLRDLATDASASRLARDSGQFSLAGAQPKTALFFDGKRWGVPSGRIPTTHILKPGIAGRAGHAENEHYCLTLASELGLPVASSRVVRFGDQAALVVERYDRLRRSGRVIRVHQEDLCQALAVHPARKYENEGGPSARAVADLLRASSRAPDEDIDAFVDALAFQWLVAGTDAHAKNYSVLLGAEGRVRLAPLYDLASALPYPDLQVRKLKLAMKIGGTYRLHDVGVHAWGKLAKELRLDADRVRARVRSLAESACDAAPELVRTLRAGGLRHPLLTRLGTAVGERAEAARALFR